MPTVHMIVLLLMNVMTRDTVKCDPHKLQRFEVIYHTPMGPDSGLYGMLIWWFAVPVPRAHLLNY